jgi:putative transposase
MSYRQEVLNAHIFSTLEQVRGVTEEWRETYKEYRPHDALGRMPRPRT